jgi:hypothetical protein
MAIRMPLSVEMDMESTDILKEILEDSVDEFLDEVRNEIELAWRRRATNSSRLNTTKKRYLDAIEVKREGDDITMYLTDELAASLESGQDPYDLKPGFLKGHTHRVVPLVNSRSGETKFRTISAKSSPWVHPGLEPRGLVQDVQEEATTEIFGEIFSAILSKVSV